MLNTTTSKTVAVGRFGGCECLGELFEVRVDLVASRSFNLMAEPDGHCREGVSSRNRSCVCESPTLRRAWLNRSIGSSKRVWIRYRRYRVRHGNEQVKGSIPYRTATDLSNSRLTVPSTDQHSRRGAGRKGAFGVAMRWRQAPPVPSIPRRAQRPGPRERRRSRVGLDKKGQ